MEVAIISMAQQARPNCSGQTEFLRPQLYKSASFVVKIPCLLSSLRSPSSIRQLVRFKISLPGQNPFPPSPNEPFHQQQQKHHHGDKSPNRQAGKGDRKGQQKNGFNIKNEENNAVKIILGPELHPGIALRLQSAFVNGIFVGAGLFGREQFRPKISEKQRGDGKTSRRQQKNGDEQIRIVFRHTSASDFVTFFTSNGNHWQSMSQGLPVFPARGLPLPIPPSLQAAKLPRL